MNILTSATTPSAPCGTRNEVSRTSLDLAPKIAYNNFSSGVCSVNPFGARLLKMSYQEKKDFEHIEEEIAALEEELAFIEKESEANGRDYVYLAKLQEQKDEAEGKLLEKYERYEYLTELQKRIDAGEKV